MNDSLHCYTKLTHARGNSTRRLRDVLLCQVLSQAWNPQDFAVRNAFTVLAVVLLCVNDTAAGIAGPMPVASYQTANFPGICVVEVK
jgi:hypothetical protein